MKGKQILWSGLFSLFFFEMILLSVSGGASGPARPSLPAENTLSEVHFCFCC